MIKVRTYAKIYKDFLKWMYKKTGDNKYRYDTFFSTGDKKVKEATLYKLILDLCYDKTDGLYYFSKFIIGDLQDIGYPYPFHYNSLFRKWDKLVKKHDRLAVLCARGHGKAQSLKSKVLTPTGWTTVQQLKVGDDVIGANGLSTKVIKLHPIEKLPLYKLSTNDGRTTICSENHLWTVESIKDNTVLTLPLHEILKNYRTEKNNKVNYNYYIKNVQPIEFANGEFDFDFYPLGILIGTASKISETAEINNTFIYTSIENRIKLVQGLVDSVGNISFKDNNFYFNNIPYKLTHDITNLIRSLGGIIYIRINTSSIKLNSQPHYNLTCSLPIGIIDRKSTRLNSSHIPLSRMPSSA